MSGGDPDRRHRHREAPRRARNSGRSMRHARRVFSIAAKELIEKASQIASFLSRPRQASGRCASFQPIRRNPFHVSSLRAPPRPPCPPLDLRRGSLSSPQRDARRPSFPNAAPVCECEVDPETGRCGSCATAGAVDDVGHAASTRFIVHGRRTHGRSGRAWARRSGALPSRSLRGQPPPLADDYRHAAPATICPVRSDIVKCFRRPIRSASRRAAKAGTTPAPPPR